MRRAPPIRPFYIRPRFRGLGQIIDNNLPPIYASNDNPPFIDPGQQILPEVTVSSTPLYPTQQPIWPLLVIMSAVGYTLFWMGGHR